MDENGIALSSLGEKTCKRRMMKRYVTAPTAAETARDRTEERRSMAGAKIVNTIIPPDKPTEARVLSAFFAHPVYCAHFNASNNVVRN